MYFNDYYFNNEQINTFLVAALRYLASVKITKSMQKSVNTETKLHPH